jgi:hypothetical protein
MRRFRGWFVPSGTICRALIHRLGNRILCLNFFLLTVLLKGLLLAEVRLLVLHWSSLSTTLCFPFSRTVGLRSFASALGGSSISDGHNFRQASFRIGQPGPERCYL